MPDEGDVISIKRVLMLKNILLGFFLLVSLPAFAGNIWCAGKITGVYVGANGDVIINGDWRNGWTRVCNVKTGSVDTVTCSLWSSYAASAVQNNLNVRLMYTGDFQCNNIPTYASAPAPQYLMLEK